MEKYVQDLTLGFLGSLALAGALDLILSGASSCFLYFEGFVYLFLVPVFVPLALCGA